MIWKSYEDKTFFVEDNETLLRDENDLKKFTVYAAGDVIPAGKKIGDRKVVPKRTEVRVTGVRTDEARTVFVKMEPVNANPEIPVGWTKASNLLGQFLNETTGLLPTQWALPPLNNNCTVTGAKSVILSGPPDFASTGKSIPPGAFVIVTQRASDGANAKISGGQVSGGQPAALEAIGWTKAGNLIEGWSDVFVSPAWSDEKGPNACWERGKFIGGKILVDIVGTGTQMEQVTLDSLDAYLRLKNEAAKKNLVISINSGFRTFQSQQELFAVFQNGGNLAAQPGKSNHQHGQAFDLNTGGFDGSPIYDWLKKNGPRLGFIRTVNKEHWHWEFRPEDAKRLAAQGKFKLDSVKK